MRCEFLKVARNGLQQDYADLGPDAGGRQLELLGPGLTSSFKEWFSEVLDPGDPARSRSNEFCATNAIASRGSCVYFNNFKCHKGKTRDILPAHTVSHKIIPDLADRS